MRIAIRSKRGDLVLHVWGVYPNNSWGYAYQIALGSGLLTVYWAFAGSRFRACPRATRWGVRHARKNNHADRNTQ